MDVHAQGFFIDNSIFPPADFVNLGNLLTRIIGLLTTIAAILSIIFIIVAGFKFVTAAGDEKKLASAKSTLTYAIVGLVALILTFIILQVVQWFLRAQDVQIFR